MADGAKTKPALAAKRTLDLLNHLTLHPRKSFTLSELASALGVSPASMSSILLAMRHAGYVVRNERNKSYEIGPALVAAGHAAALGHPLTRLASVEMERLAHFGTECIGSAPVGEDLAILSVAGRPSGNGLDARVGQRWPLMPPFGQAFMAWASEEIVERWLRHAPYSARESLLRSLAVVREHGYVVVLENEAVAAVQDLIVRSARRPLDLSTQAALRALIPTQVEDYTLLNIVSAETYKVHALVAPVFDADERVVHALTIQGIGELPGDRILAVGRELLASTRALTRSIGGIARVGDHEKVPGDDGHDAAR